MHVFGKKFYTEHSGVYLKVDLQGTELAVSKNGKEEACPIKLTMGAELRKKKSKLLSNAKPIFSLYGHIFWSYLSNDSKSVALIKAACLFGFIFWLFFLPFPHSLSLFPPFHEASPPKKSPYKQYCTTRTQYKSRGNIDRVLSSRLSNGPMPPAAGDSEKVHTMSVNL